MNITDKTLKAFNKWNYENDFGYIDYEPTSLVVHFEDLDENLRNSIIVDFFDSVGLHININTHRNNKYFIYSINNDDFGLVNSYNTRHEAIEKAIIQANKLYNENTSN